MKRLDQTFRCLAAGLVAGLALGLGSGCASSASSNRRVYDRYAELVAARNRTQQESEKASAAPAVPRAESSKSVEAAEPPKSKPRPAKPAPEKEESAKPTPPKSKPEPAKSDPPVAVAPEIRPEPAPVPPVQVLAPKPTDPVRPAPVRAPEPPPAPPPAPAEPPARSPAASPVVDGRPSSSDSTSYLLKVGDFIQIYLRGIPGGEAIEDFIDEDGEITLPLINEVMAAGTTPSDLERSIRKIYQDLDIYKNISVTVVVPARYYFIQGEVRAPGRYQITSAMRVSQAIAGAAGYSEYASGRVVVKRGGRIVKNIRNARRLERAPEDDILLEPDDIVEVKRSWW